MNEPNLSDFVAFGVGIAGFASIVVAVGQREGRLREYDRFRVVQLFICALIPAFVALLEGMLASFGIRGENACRVASAVLMISIGADTCLAITMSRRMSIPARSSPSPTMWRIGLALGLVLMCGMGSTSWVGLALHHLGLSSRGWGAIRICGNHVLSIAIGQNRSSRRRCLAYPPEPVASVTATATSHKVVRA